MYYDKFYDITRTIFTIFWRSPLWAETSTDPFQVSPQVDHPPSRPPHNSSSSADVSEKTSAHSLQVSSFTAYVFAPAVYADREVAPPPVCCRSPGSQLSPPHAPRLRCYAVTADSISGSCMSVAMQETSNKGNVLWEEALIGPWRGVTERWGPDRGICRSNITETLQQHSFPHKRVRHTWRQDRRRVILGSNLFQDIFSSLQLIHVLNWSIRCFSGSMWSHVERSKRFFCVACIHVEEVRPSNKLPCDWWERLP